MGSATSAAGVIGPGSNAAVFINNSGVTSATFKLQVSGASSASAGLNNLPSQWYDYQRAAGTTVSLVVANGTAICFELAPFTPELVRLVRTDSSGSVTIEAFIVCFGPN